MFVFNNIIELQGFLQKSRNLGKKIGFVPTMGALHTGHISLVKQARKDNEIVVVSIFVNPTQFNDKEDFNKYPITTDSDTVLLEQAACDVLFLPPVTEVYPHGTDNSRVYEFGYLETVLEGAFRPNHFKGVGQVMARLLDIVQPDTLYLGQKDYQQCMVIKKLIALMGLDDKISVVTSPTVRESDGLAMSSRNRRLTDPQRALASTMYQCLVSVQAKQNTDTFELVRKECIDLLTDKGFMTEYISLADAGDLAIMDEFDPNRKMVVLIAAKLGTTRLIDNMLLN